MTVPAPRPLTGFDDPTLTLADILAHLRDRIDAVLVDEAAIAGLARIARAVPAALTPFWGLEIRLGDPAAQADILWEVRKGTRGAALLAGAVDGHDDGLATLCANAPVWQAMRRFARSWGGEGAGSLVRNLWFEADAASARSTDELDAALGKPSLFWGPLHGSDRALVAALPDLARDVFGLSVTPPPLAAAAAALPAAAEIFQFGVMGSRAGTLTRLCVRGMTEAETVAWLATIGWPGDPAAAIAWVAPYVAAAHSFALNVDLLDGQTGPKLGIELYREPGDIDPALWRGLFAMLQADGLALEAKSEAILRYPGTERFNQSAVWRERKGWGYPLLSRSIHHLKVVATPAGLVEAKAYLGAYRPAMDYGAVFRTLEDSDKDAWLEP